MHNELWPLTLKNKLSLYCEIRRRAELKKQEVLCGGGTDDQSIRWGGAGRHSVTQRSDWVGRVCNWEMKMWKWACHHLHSTATVFWAGEAEDGLMPVSEDPDDVDAVMLDTVGHNWLLISDSREQWQYVCVGVILQWPAAPPWGPEVCVSCWGEGQRGPMFVSTFLGGFVSKKVFLCAFYHRPVCVCVCVCTVYCLTYLGCFSSLCFEDQASRI